MIIRSVRHRGLRRLLVADDARSLPPFLVGRIRNILTVMLLVDGLEGFIAESPPGWRIHRLTGDRRKEWSVSVSGNWRITFEESQGEITRMNLEDYH